MVAWKEQRSLEPSSVNNIHWLQHGRAQLSYTAARAPKAQITLERY